MIRINLLPHREMRREKRKKEFVSLAGVIGAAGVATALAVGFGINSQIDAQTDRNNYIKAKNSELDSQIAEIANLEAEAIAGENESSAKEAISIAELEERKAEARRRSDVARAESLKAILEAEKIAELARLEKEEIIRNEINKRKQVIDAEAKAQETVNLAKGDADSTLLKFQAEAKGMEELLNAKANGYKEIIEACGGDSKAAATLLLLEQMESLVSRQTEALANLKIDKITVWDSGNGSGNGSGGEGTNATAGFIRNFISALPPIHDLAKQVGIDLPDYLGSMTANDVLANMPPAGAEEEGEVTEAEEIEPEEA